LKNFQKIQYFADILHSWKSQQIAKKLHRNKNWRNKISPGYYTATSLCRNQIKMTINVKYKRLLTS